MAKPRIIKNFFYILPAVFITNMLFLTSAFADDFAVNKISELQKQILNDNSKLSKIELEIQNLDMQIAEKVAKINKLTELINKIITTKLDLQSKKSQQYEILSQQKQQLLKQLEGTYILHRNNNLQKLAKIDNMQQLSRLLNYIESFNNNSTKKIDDIKASIAQIEQLDKNLDILNTEQQNFKQKFTLNYNNLEEIKKNNLKFKQQLVTILNKNKSSLHFYQTTQKNIEQTAIQSHANNSENYNPNTPFGKAKGQLLLPVAGELDNSFKSASNRQAIFIKTPEGQKVKSVFDGQVVFSNWLRGFGFLTIVNHGNGYMSLYGHNQTLLKKAGDKIKAGEAIALSGSSGGAMQSGLYFEIRHNGNTINPLAWLKTDEKTLLS